MVVCLLKKLSISLRLSYFEEDFLATHDSFIVFSVFVGEKSDAPNHGGRYGYVFHSTGDTQTVESLFFSFNDLQLM